MTDETIKRDTVEYNDPTPFDNSELQSISEISKALRHKMHGEDVREPIAQQGEALIKLMQETGGNQTAEVQAARGNFDLLGIREDAQDNAINRSFDAINTKFSKNDADNYLKSITVVPEAFADLAAIKAKYPNGANGVMVAAANGHKYIWANGVWTDAGVYQSSSAILKINTKQYTPDTVPNGYKDLNTFPMNEIVSFSGNAKGFLTNLPDDFPDGYANMSIMTYGFSQDEIDNGTSQTIIADTGATQSRMYFRALSRNSQGVQSAGWISDNHDELNRTIKSVDSLYTQDKLPDELKDLNNYPLNENIVYSGNVVGVINNVPEDLIPGRYYNMGVVTLSLSNHTLADNGTVQYLSLEWSSNTGSTSATYARALARNSEGIVTPAWQRLSDDYESGSLSLFSKIGVIGDSYASGSITVDGADGSDLYQISWPQIMGRACGAQVTNFTHGGANTGLWTAEDYGMAKMKAADPQDLYICALGINDAAGISRGEEAMGSIDDVGSTTATTFYRYYSDIIKAIQEKAPHACIVMTTLVYSPMTMENLYTMNVAIKELANHFKIPCIDLQNDDFFTSSFYANAIQAEAAHSHPTAPVYAGMAKRMQVLIEKDMVTHKVYYDQFPFGHPGLDAKTISVPG